MKTTIRCAALVTALFLSVQCAVADDVQTLVAGISDANADVRAEAWKKAGPVGAKAVAPLGDLLISPTPGIAKAAREALTNITHHAGRPGADADRAAVAAALVKLLDAKYSVDARREALYLLSLVAGDPEAPAIAALLKEHELGEDARLCLERMPGDAATKALIDALTSAPGYLRSGIAHSLVYKKPDAVIPALKQVAGNTKGEISLACLETLARLGVAPDQVWEHADLLWGPEGIRYTNIVLRAADVLAAKGDKTAAEKLYGGVTASKTEPPQICAALMGLADLKSSKLGEMAVARLDAAGVRDVAIVVLAPASAIDEKALVAAYEKATPGGKTGILRVLGRRKAPALDGLLKAAATDTSPEVRVLAGQLSGSPASEEDLWDVAVSGSPWERGPAVEAYLKAASGKAAGSPAESAKMFVGVVGAECPNAYKIQALAGIEQIARPEFLDLTKGLMGNADLAVAAGRAYTAIVAAQPDKEQAKKQLFALAEEKLPVEVMAAAVERLRGLGADTQAIPKRQGFITAWKLLGTFPNEGGAGFRKSFLSEKDADGAKEIISEGKKYLWKDVSTDRAPAVIDLRAQFDQKDNVTAYAYAEISVEKEEPVAFLLGSDDGCEFWVNGQKLHEIGGGRSMVADGDRVEATLKPGKNSALIKVLQGGGDWQFCVRVAHRDGKPFNLAR